MVRKSEASKYDYDLQNDSIFFYGEDKKYKSSVELEGVILDFNEEDYLTGIEILDASEKFNVSKADLLNIKNFNATIIINKENIDVRMKMEYYKRNKLIDTNLNALALNTMNLPSSTQGIAVTC
ncbi:MAG: DUF2283 domain-containing protein [Methanosarcinales archaeon]|nr:DUF2283 domain-containing protein [Methanosarcinales archaeon]